MAILSSAKHVTGEIDGVRCTVVESNVTKARMEFLKELLSFNRLDVKVREEAPAGEASESLFTVGVTDLLFNPVIAVYERTLRRPDGAVVTPAWYKQLSGNTDVPYYTYGRMWIPDMYE